MGRLVRLRNILGKVHAARHDPHLPRAELPRRLGEGVRRAQDDPGATNERADGDARPAGELGVGAPELEDEGLASSQRRQRGRKPVRVDEVGSLRRTARRARVREEEQRHEDREPGTPSQVPEDPVPVGDAEVPERSRGHDLDVDAGGA